MKKILMTIACLLPMLVIGQTQTENYIKTTVYQQPVEEGQEDNLEPSQKIENINYVDGLGRSKQTISIRAGGAKQNIVSYMEYDDLGRTPKQFLPYATTTEVVNPFELLDLDTLKTNIEAFYNTAKYEHTLNPYSEVVYESSPLNRVTTQAAPGNSWALANNHTIKMEYQSNALDEVRYFDVTFTGGDTTTPDITLSGYYNPEVLYKMVTKDENWTTTSGTDHTVEEFTNKQGQVLLKRTYDTGQTHDTYYVYDDFGNLTFVLSPEGSSQIVNGSSLVSNYQDILDRLCYQYRYDYRNRLVEKKIPAKGWEYIFYDQLDRPVLTQDARLRENNQYLFTKYDALNRVLYTGIYQATSGSSDPPVQTTISTQSSFNETRATATNVGGNTIYYSNGIFPSSNITIHTVNYYDSYIDHAGITLPATVYADSLTTDTQGLSTVSKVRVLETNDWITTVTGYDEKARPVYGISVNTYLDTEDMTESRLDFIGNVLESRTTHQKTGHQAIVTTDYFTYDHQNRLITHIQQIDDEPVQLITHNTYDELGQLESKRVGGQLSESGYTGITSHIQVTENVIEKISGGTVWNAGLYTIGKLEGDGRLSFTNLTDNKRYLVGFNNLNTTDSHDDIDYGFGFYWNNPGRFRVVERESSGNGTTTYLTGYISFEANDTFAIERQGDLLEFIHNGNVIASYMMTQSYTSLIGDVSIRDEGAQIGNLNLYATTIDKSLQKVDYEYNVRGWLTDINDANENTRSNNDLFTFHINYDNVVEGDAGIAGRAVPLYNGNISQTTWQTANSDTQKRTYGYKYDALNRMKVAYSRKGANLTDYDHFNVSGIDYDKNGNIETLTRQGDYNGNALTMDDLTYTYNGNQLLRVSDNGHVNLKNEGFYEGNSSAISDDYEYDVNGNMVKDRNKGISTITYNHLNLPTSITINDVVNNNNGSITYIYDATGIKLAKVLVDNSQGTPKTTSYAGGYIYEETGGAETLQLFSHPEGYVEPVTINGVPGYQYAFNYTDHLGNVRLTYADSDRNGLIDSKSEIISEKHYYPYGLKQKGYNDGITSNKNDVAEKFKYNGIEKEEALGLNLYEMDLRQYDPAIARWTGIDPVVHYDKSTYNAFDNNPVFWADPSGANSTAEWMEANGITDDDLINVYQADDSNSNSNGNESSPPDDYVFNENGNFVRIDKNNEPDKLVIENSETGDRNEYNFNDPVTDVATINHNLKVWGTVFSDIKFIYTLTPERIQAMMKESDVSYRNWVSRRWYAFTESVGGKMDFSVYHLSIVLAENETDHLWDPGSIMKDRGPLFIPPSSNTVYNLLDQGNYLWGSSMRILGFTEQQAVDAAKGYNKNDSNADIKAVKAGFNN